MFNQNVQNSVSEPVINLVLLLVNVSHDHKIVVKSPFIFYGSTTTIY